MPVAIFLTTGFVSSANCRRELKRALREKKTLLVILETDDNHGATSHAALAAEVKSLPYDSEDRAACQTLLERVAQGACNALQKAEHCKKQHAEPTQRSIPLSRVEHVDR